MKYLATEKGFFKDRLVEIGDFVESDTPVEGKWLMLVAEPQDETILKKKSKESDQQK